MSHLVEQESAFSDIGFMKQITAGRNNSVDSSENSEEINETLSSEIYPENEISIDE
jgi:hypothetical protein